MLFFSRVFASTTRAKSLVHNVWTHDLAERLKIRRASLAMLAGLKAGYDVGSYPPVKVFKSGWLVAAVLAAGTLAASVPVGYWLTRLAEQRREETRIERITETTIGVGVEVIPPAESQSSPDPVTRGAEP